MPVHGEVRHMKEQAAFGRSCGIPKAVFQKNGDLVRLAPGHPGKFGEVHSGRLLLDGDIIAPADGEAMVMRRRISYQGVVSVAATLNGKVEVSAVGLPLDEDYADFVVEAEEDVAKALQRTRNATPEDRHEAVRLATRRAATRWSGKKPQVQVLILGND